MRRRKVKGADIKLLSYKDYVLKEDLESLKGNWSQKFKNNNPIHAEFGTGRGKFITTLAKENPDINYIAMEIKEEVLDNIISKKDVYYRPYSCKEGRITDEFIKPFDIKKYF